MPSPSVHPVETSTVIIQFNFPPPKSTCIEIHWTWHYSKQQNLYIFCNFYTITDGKSLGLHTFIIVIKYTDSHTHTGQSQSATRSRPHTLDPNKTYHYQYVPLLDNSACACVCVWERETCQSFGCNEILVSVDHSGACECRKPYTHCKASRGYVGKVSVWRKGSSKTKDFEEKWKKRREWTHFSIFRTQHKIYESCSALLICTKLV